jgi:hypothetical protein
MEKEILITTENLYEGKWVLSIVTEEKPRANPDAVKEITALYFLTKYDSKNETNWEVKALDEEARKLIEGKQLGNPSEPIPFGKIILRRFPEFEMPEILKAQKM